MTNLQPGVRERLESPTPGRDVTLIVGVTDSSSKDVTEAVEDVGGEVEETLYYDSLAVTINESDLDALCSLDTVLSLEIEGEWEPMEDAEENFRSRLVSTQ